MPYFHGTAARKYPCDKCDESIPEWDGIFCDTCTNWYHFKCDQLEIQHQEAFRELPEAPYICKSCRCDEKGVFSFTNSLSRLHKGAKQGFEKLLMYAERERQFMKEDFSYTNTKSPKWTTDNQIDALVREFCPSQSRKAAKVTKDGNSLFSAVSVALVGSERLATELRVRCCIEMVVYDSFYMWQENFPELERCAPEYRESCLNCATPGEDSCVWTMSAVASVVRRRIDSIYPAVNGKMDQAWSILNTVFTPRSKLDNGESLKIFWGGPKKGDLPPAAWVPEVFVPLVDIPMVPTSPVAVSPYLTPSRVSGRVRKPTAKVLAITNKKIKTEVKVVVEEALEDDDNDSDFKMPADFTLEPTEEDVLEQKYQIEKIDLNWMDKYTEVAEGGISLKGTAFLPAQEVFTKLTSCKEVLPRIPYGRKEDVYFLVDNSKNLKYKYRRNYFQDDCGRYDQRSGTTCKAYYLLSSNNMLQQLMKVKGKYCKESKRVTASGEDSPPGGRGRPPLNRKGRGRNPAEGRKKEQKVTKWIPMTPQPDEEQVIVLHRYYSSLDVDPTYRRRISWFSNLPSRLESGHSSFLVEYITKPIAGLILPQSRKGGVCSIPQSANDDDDDEMAEEGIVASQVSDVDTSSQGEDVEMKDQTADASMIDPITGELKTAENEASEKAVEETEKQSTPVESQTTETESQESQTESQATESETRTTEENPENTNCSMIVEAPPAEVDETQVTLVQAEGEVQMQIVYVEEGAS